MARVLLVSLLSLALLNATLAQPFGPERKSNDQRIVGGYETDISRHPHQISLRYRALLANTNPFSHRCGGSIIDSDKILTAAHCVIATVASQYKVVAGTNLRQGSDGFIVNVKEIIMHEEYNPSTYENDVALLILEPHLPLNNFTVKAIKLAERAPLDGATSTITGWGTTIYGGLPSDKLMAVDVPIVGNDICEQDYGVGRITDSMVCAGVRGVGGKDACQGDSGGPLVVYEQLHGVVSWGYACADPDYPGVYASVAHLLGWIKSKVTLP